MTFSTRRPLHAGLLLATLAPLTLGAITPPVTPRAATDEAALPGPKDTGLAKPLHAFSPGPFRFLTPAPRASTDVGSSSTSISLTDSPDLSLTSSLGSLNRSFGSTGSMSSTASLALTNSSSLSLTSSLGSLNQSFEFMGNSPMASRFAQPNSPFAQLNAHVAQLNSPVGQPSGSFTWSDGTRLAPSSTQAATLPLPATLVAAPLAVTDAERIAAYRADLRDRDRPAPLTLVDGQALATLMKVGIEIFKVVGDDQDSSPAIYAWGALNPDRLQKASQTNLLIHQGQYHMLEAADGALPDFIDWSHGPDGEPYVLAGEKAPNPANDLIAFLHQIEKVGRPDPREYQDARDTLATILTDAEILEAFASVRADLIAESAPRPTADGPFAGCGHRVSALLLRDADFMAQLEEERPSQPGAAVSASDEG